MKLIEFLKGKKTYIVAFLIALVVFAQQLGWINAELATVLFGLLGAGGLATLRAGVAKAE